MTILGMYQNDVKKKLFPHVNKMNAQPAPTCKVCIGYNRVISASLSVS